LTVPIQVKIGCNQDLANVRERIIVAVILAGVRDSIRIAIGRRPRCNVLCVVYPITVAIRSVVLEDSQLVSSGNDDLNS
jgi:hypothetical protein